MPHTAVGGPAPLPARQGRLLQKYGEAGERLVAGCVPVRFKPGVDGPDAVEVLMISSRAGKGHVFPKGGWETDETVDVAARRETLEEAGVRGELEEPMLGAFPFHSSKAERLHTAHKGRCVAYVFVMHVSEELTQWPEASHRKREWCSLQEACNRARYAWMRDALILWIRRKGWDHIVPACLPQNGSTASLQGADAFAGGEVSALAAQPAAAVNTPIVANGIISSTA